MPDNESSSGRLAGITEAFREDDFNVVGKAWTQDGKRFGLRAEHVSALDRIGKPKTVFYVEGSPGDMGYLMGRLAEGEIQRMSEDYIENYLRDVLGLNAPKKKGDRDWPIYKYLVRRVNELTPPGDSSSVLEARNEEIEGMLAGCLEANPKTEVTRKRLWALNLGIDYLFALLYAGVLKLATTLLFKGKKVALPSGCNAMAVLNEAAADGAIFARDFMFPACGVFHDCATTVIYNPLPREVDGPLPIIAMTVPGFVGSVSAMNTAGVAAGVDVVQGRHNTPDLLGVNSLMLVRHAVERARSVEEAADIVCETPRGVCWLYPMAGSGGEAKRDRACVVEASATSRDKLGNPTDLLNFLAFADADLKRPKNLLPERAFLMEKAQAASPFRQGAMVRWETFKDPCGELGYGVFNKGLWERAKKEWEDVKGQFGPDGMINATHRTKNCPSGSYFAPLRVESEDIVLASNHYLCPEMRLTTMSKVPFQMEPDYPSDSQWRYDRLNQLVREARGCVEGEPTNEADLPPISEEKAKELINYLEPACTHGPCIHADRENCYHFTKYASDACKKRWRAAGGPAIRLPKLAKLITPSEPADLPPIPIEGAISVFNLAKRTIDSYYGYYGDPWVKLRLLPYVDGAR